MARIPQEKIEEIRGSVNIVDVVGQYLDLQKSGSGYKAICPFHNDSHPSLSVSDQKQIYRCFVCNNGGNVFTFLQEFLKISYIEAVMQVAQMGHIDMTQYQYEKKEKNVNQELIKYYDMHKEAEKIYSYYLQTRKGTLAKDYCRQRDFDDDIIQKFGIGYAPDKAILFDAFTKLGYKEIDIVKSGLVIESYNHYDRFNDRVMFPLHDEDGRVVGFSGRIYKSSQDSAKYLNSPESEIFIKGQTLYNYHRCKQAVRNEGFVYINEGFMDVIAMSKAGYDNVIALMGTALTNGHVQMLKRLTKHIVLMLDGDKAGLAATKKSTEFLMDNGFDVRIIMMPEGRDPDEILSQEGIEGLNSVLKEKLTPIDFLLTYEYSRLDINNYDDRKKLLEIGCKLISKIDDEVDKQHYIEKLSKLTSFSIEIINGQLRSVPVKKQNYNFIHRIEEEKPLLDKYVTAERNLIYYMLSDKAVSDLYEKKVGFMYNDTYRLIASYIVDYYRRHIVMNEAELIDQIGYDKNRLISVLADIASMELPIPYEQKAIDDYIKTISLNARKMKVGQLKEQFNYVLDPTKKAEILKEIIDLQKEAKNG